MTFLPLLLVAAAAVAGAFLMADLRKDSRMTQYYKDIARIEWQNALMDKTPYETEIVEMREYAQKRKCS